MTEKSPCAAPAIEPCPFCGGKAACVPRAVNIVLQKDPSDPKFGVSVICGKCGSESPNVIDEATAIQRWNRRAALATPAGGDAVPVAWMLRFSDPDPGIDIDFTAECPPAWEGQAEPLYASHRRDSVHLTSDFVAHGLPTPLPEGGWRSIDTAPKDGRLFLCWVHAVKFGEDDDGRRYEQDVSCVDFCQWRTISDPPTDEGGYFEACAGPWGDGQNITHWMPLPAAPASQDDREAERLPAGNEVRPQDQPESGGMK